jgi:hypothetical protein
VILGFLFTSGVHQKGSGICVFGAENCIWQCQSVICVFGSRWVNELVDELVLCSLVTKGYILGLTQGANHLDKD